MKTSRPSSEPPGDFDLKVPRTAWRHDPHLDPMLQWTSKAGRLAVKIDDDRGIGSVKIIDLDGCHAN